MSKFVVVVTNNDGGAPATLHDTIDAAKQAVRDWLLDPDGEPAPDAREIARMEDDLRLVDGSCVQGVHGSDAWKEWIYIAPLAE